MIVTITSSIPARNSGFVWFAFDAADHASLDEIHHDLRQFGVIKGDRIDTAVVNGARRVIRRTFCILGAASIAMITPLHTEIVDETGAVLE
jgi:hypothetical protein